MHTHDSVKSGMQSCLQPYKKNGKKMYTHVSVKSGIQPYNFFLYVPLCEERHAVLSYSLIECFYTYSLIFFSLYV